MFEVVKNQWRKHMIKKMMNEPRSKRIANLEEVKEIGIIFRVGDEYDWNVIYHFIKIMEGQKKKVTVVGMQETGMKLNYIITHSNTTICRESEDMNFWGVPKEEKIKDFTSRHYDLLIDTTEQPDFFGKYITLRTEADLRVARIDTSDDKSLNSGEIYDMMIHNEGPLDMKDYLNNVAQYLSAIQK